MKKALLFAIAGVALAACAYYVGDQFKYDSCVDKCQKILGKGVTDQVAMRDDAGQCVCLGIVRKDMAVK